MEEVCGNRVEHHSSIGAAVAETCCQQYHKQAFDLEGHSTEPRIKMTGDLVVACSMAINPSGENNGRIRLETSQAPWPLYSRERVEEHK